MKRVSDTNRRHFLLAGLASLPWLSSCARGAAADACRATAQGAGGPFYRAGAPWRTKLCDVDEPGEPLRITGRVLAADTCQPLKGATIDVWQANAAGRYDNEDQSRLPDPDKYFLRGQMKADAEGRYHFETIMPGNYGDGRNRRARHIHYIVSCPGYQPLTTECYFEGDQNNATDRLVRPTLVVPLTNFSHERERRKYLGGTFDVVLLKA